MREQGGARTRVTVKWQTTVTSKWSQAAKQQAGRQAGRVAVKTTGEMKCVNATLNVSLTQDR